MSGIIRDKSGADARMKTQPLECLMHDIQHGARMLAKSPGFTLLAAATFALGIGVNVTMFSVVNSALLPAVLRRASAGTGRSLPATPIRGPDSAATPTSTT